MVLILLAAIVVLLPQSVLHPSVARATPTLSGALPLYPLNHTFDASSQIIGSPAASYDFEAAGYAVGTPPTNADLSATPIEQNAPTNSDFATGDFTGWAVIGSPQLGSDAPHGWFARLANSSQSLTSSPFVVNADAQAFAFDWGRLATNDFNWLRVYVLSGSGFTTSTKIFDQYCMNCGNWQAVTVDASAYLGQTIELRRTSDSTTSESNRRSRATRSAARTRAGRI